MLPSGSRGLPSDEVTLNLFPSFMASGYLDIDYSLFTFENCMSREVLDEKNLLLIFLLKYRDSLLKWSLDTPTRGTVCKYLFKNTGPSIMA